MRHLGWLKNAKKGNFWRVFENLKLLDSQTVLPDKSVLKEQKLGKQFTYIFYGSSHQELLRRKPRIKVLPEWSSFWYVGYLVFWAKMVAGELWKGAFILRQFHKLQFCTAKLAKHRWAAGEQRWLCKSSLYLKHISKALLMHVFIQFRLLYKLELHNRVIVHFFVR